MRRISVLALTLVVLALGARAADAQPIGPFAITAQDVSGTCATASACVDFDIGNGTAQALTIDISGTWTGTLTFYASVTGSSGTFRIITVTNVTDLSTTQTTTAAGAWTVSNVGYGIVRVRATAAMTGSAAVSARRGFLNARMSNTPSFTTLRLADGTAAAPSLTFASEPTKGFYSSFSNAVSLSVNSLEQVLWNTAEQRFGSAYTLGWSSATRPLNGNADTILARDAANTLAQRNGTNAQTLNVYGTYTDASNYERGQIYTDASGLNIRHRGLGTGSSRAINFDAYWRVTTAGHFVGVTPTVGLGYATGAGGTVTQATSKATGVTLNTVTGEITMNAAALAANTTVTFTLTDSAIAAGDYVECQHVSAGTAGAYNCTALAAAGSATINVRNLTAGSLSEAIVVKFMVFKSATA